MKNIFEIFDSMSTGRVGQNEILWVFSMAMNGTVQQKLQWLFKLYDKVLGSKHNFYIQNVIKQLL